MVRSFFLIVCVLIATLGSAEVPKLVPWYKRFYPP